MRDTGIPKVVSWRWAPCAALVLGSLFFVGFALLAIPERIGEASANGASTLQLGSHFAANQAKTPADWSDGSDGFASGTSAHVDSALPGSATRVATHGADLFPKRGFTPPLERAESSPPSPPPAFMPPPSPPPAFMPPPSPPPAAVAPEPAAEAAPVPPSALPASEAAPAPSPAEAELPSPRSDPAPDPVAPQTN